MSGIAIRKSKIEGQGIFATKKFQRGEFIFTVQGPVIKYTVPPDWRVGPDWLNVGENSWKIPYSDNPWIFINHSCNPNAIVRNGNKVMALRPIASNDEITIDYSLTETMRSWRMKCKCGLKTCRATIKSVQFLSRDVFEKYKKYLSKFLQQEYQKQRVEIDENTGKVLAKQVIKEGETAFTANGPIITYRKNPNYRLGLRWLGIGKNKWLIPDEQDPLRFLNHSCGPNVGLKNQTRIVAMRTIYPGEEILIDYSLDEADPRWKIKCDCGSVNCRGIIRSVQFLPKDLYTKYLPYIPAFFKKVYLQYNRN